jgi:hypothetical protein
VRVAARGSGSLLRRRGDPLRSCERTEGTSGTRARQATADEPLVRRVYARWLGARGVPGVQGLGRRVATFGRCEETSEGAPAGPDAEAAAARWPARRRGVAGFWRCTIQTRPLQARFSPKN